MVNEIKGEIERAIYSLIGSGEGYNPYPKWLRFLFGDTQRFVLPKNVTPWWLHRVPYTLAYLVEARGVKENSLVDIRSTYWDKRWLPKSLDPLNVFGVNASVEIGVETVIGKEEPRRVFYKLCIPKDFTPYHILNVVPGKMTGIDLGEVKPMHLEDMLDYLKQVQSLKTKQG